VIVIVSYSNIIVTIECKIQLVETIIITEAAVVETTEVAASVASNVATAVSSTSSQKIVPILYNVR